MPSFWTHFAFANDCRKRLLSRVGSPAAGTLTEAVAAYPHAFCTGMQGPDPFLFYLPAAFRKRRLSSVMHTEETAKLLCRVFTRAHAFRGEERRIALSYAAGFLGHYLLDSHTHAFVYARAGTVRSADSFCIHNALEADLNALAIRRSFGKQLREMPRPRAYELSSAERRVLCTLYSDLLERVYKIRCSPAKVARALWSVRQCYRVLYDPRGRKATAVRMAEEFAGRAYLSPLFLGESHYFEDPANSERRVWVDPFTKKPSRATFFELYDRALEAYVPLLTRLESSEGNALQARRALFAQVCKRDFHGAPIAEK
ncbi:MAG: zinc dependent phospholipase C family protein [Clostridia bacterium]|nr:zinc dependent phospholipase C family protein [Clostridia bacterium]